MTKIVISGASGDLGRRVTKLLLESLPARDLTLVTRSPAKLAGSVPAEVTILAGDYNQPEALEQAYRGADVLLLISAIMLGHRVAEHRNAINAAKRAGIKHIVYTSYAGIHPQNLNLAARDHIRTEADLRSSGLEYTILRDATYSNWVYDLSIAPALKSGKWISIEGEGRFAPVAKEDVVRCVVRCLTDPSFHAGAVYEISGPELFSFRQIAELAIEVFGTPFEIVEVTPEERFAIWDSLGVPRTREEGKRWSEQPDAEWLASDELVTGETAIAQMGYQGILSDHVEFLTGRKPRSLRSVLEAIDAAGRDVCIK